MLNLTYSYRIYPGLDQEAQMLDWLEQCRRVYNYALVERKDWINSRKCLVNACSIRQESIIPADAPYPDYFKASGWYAQLILQADVSVPEPVPHGEPIGIDLGLEKFLAVSTGELVERPRFFTDLQSQLRWLQRKLRNKQKGSANYRKAQAKIRSLHEHIHNVRRDFHFLTAHRLCDRAGMIFAEDLNLKMTSRGILAKHCLDAAWGSFLEILQWVSWKRGVYFAKVDPNGTSQTCPQCGAHTGKKELNERVHHYDECGYTTDRDVAAAQVVMQRGLVFVADGQSVVLPVEEGCLATPMKQETSRAILGSPRCTA